MGMEHRWGRREATDVAVRFRANPGIIATGRVLNVSLTGAYLETPIWLRLLSVIYLELNGAAADDQAQRIAATVVRRDLKGVGLEWCESTTETAQGHPRLVILSRGSAHHDDSDAGHGRSTQVPIAARESDFRGSHPAA